MPGFQGSQVANSARNGNTVAILVGDQPVAFAQTVGHQLPMGAEQLYGIGSAKPQEIQQLRMSPQITVDSFALTAAGLQLLSNNQNLAYLLAGNQFDLHVLAGKENTTLYTYTGCKAQNFAESIPTNAPIRDTFTFLAMDVLDPNGNSIMSLPDDALTIASAAATAVANNLGLTIA